MTVLIEVISIKALAYKVRTRQVFPLFYIKRIYVHVVESITRENRTAYFASPGEYVVCQGKVRTQSRKKKLTQNWIGEELWRPYLLVLQLR